MLSPTSFSRKINNFHLHAEKNILQSVNAALRDEAGQLKFEQGILVPITPTGLTKRCVLKNRDMEGRVPFRGWLKLYLVLQDGARRCMSLVLDVPLWLLKDAVRAIRLQPLQVWQVHIIPCLLPAFDDISSITKWLSGRGHFRNEPVHGCHWGVDQYLGFLNKILWK